MKDGVDLELIQRCKEGDHSAFEKLFYLCKDSVYNIALRFTGNRQDAEDLTQEAFIKIYFGLKNFRMESSFSTWVYRITANLCFDFLRRRAKRAAVEGPSEELREVPARGGDPLFLLTQKELASKVEEAFEALKPDERLVLTLRVIERLPYKDIADILDCSIGAAKMRVHRAREAFRKKISSYLKEE